MQPNDVHPDPMPTISPQEFLDALFKAVAAERARLHIEPEDSISLALIVDNAHVSAFMAGVDAWDYPVVETISGGTNSIELFRGYERPLDADFSKRAHNGPSGHSFDFSKPAVESSVGNVHFAIIIGRSPREAGSYQDVTGVRLLQWSGAGQALVESGQAKAVSDGMFELLAASYSDNFDEEAFRSSKVFAKAVRIGNGYGDQIFSGILDAARKHGDMLQATDEEVKAHLLPQVLTVLDDIKDGIPYVAYSFQCNWSALFTVTTHKATIISANNQASVREEKSPVG